MKMALLNPAKLLKFDKEIGSIEIGKKADLVVFEQQKLLASVSIVFVDGIVNYQANYKQL
jgi:alpha-D-ribose 1-methylphosphonate 5-triphosphate diphosphatase